MRKSKFTDSQIMDAVKRVEAGFGVPDICREMGISTATFYKWRAKYGGMDVSMMSRMKELEEENRRLKVLGDDYRRLQMSALRRRINERDWQCAGQELRRWVYGGGRVLQGLVTRRQAEIAWLERGV